MLKCDRVYVDGDDDVVPQVDNYAQDLLSAVKNFEFIPKHEISETMERILMPLNNASNGKLISEAVFHHGGLTLDCARESNHVCYSCSASFLRPPC